jgi:hypothetical protein
MNSLQHFDTPLPGEWKIRMRKAEVVVLIILFSSFVYLGITTEGRERIIAVATMVVFAAVAYGSYSQEKMYRKARRPGTSIFAPMTVVRAILTREFFYFILVAGGMIAFASFMVAMDDRGYLR